jgi:hypothetical protein
MKSSRRSLIGQLLATFAGLAGFNLVMDRGKSLKATDS